MGNQPLYAVIMAGGEGTRFWPLSRRSRPKQFLQLLGDVSLLGETAARLLTILPWERIVVVATAGQAALVHETLPDLPAENLVLEPVGRSTAPCLALAGMHVVGRAPEAIMAALPADHHIHPAGLFCDALQAAARLAARRGAVVTLGVKPTRPATGYGYLQTGARAGKANGCVVRKLVAFHEKPSPQEAAAFIRAGGYFWNAGIFVVRAAHLLELVQRYVPSVGELVAWMRGAEGGPAWEQVLHERYSALAPVSFDTGVMEKHGEGLVVEARFAWSDVGSWDAMADLWSDREGNRVAGDCLAVDSRGCAIYSPGRLVALVGVEDLVVVEAGDAVLVCRKGQTERVREVVKMLREQDRNGLL